MWVKKAGPEGRDIMLKLQCKNEGFWKHFTQDGGIGWCILFHQMK